MAKKKKPVKEDKSKEKPDGITYSNSFTAKILTKPGENIKTLVVVSPRWYHNEIQKFREGDTVTLMIHNRKPKRTEAQNRYYWGVYLPLIAKEKGENDLDRLHELFKGKFLTQGVVEVLGEKVRMKKSTTELSINDFCEYIMNIEALTDVEAPPTENYGLDALERSFQGKEIEYPDEDLTPTI